jgi:DNA-binding PadR family transcriptional regulator
LVLLALLAERPTNGYELMSELGRLFAPHYRPSPGSVYPAVDALEAEGLITPREEEGPRVYQLTSLGKDALQKRRDGLAAIELRTGMRLGQRDSVDAVLERFASRVRSLAGRLDADGLERVLDSTFKNIEEETTVEQAVGGKGRP